MRSINLTIMTVIVLFVCAVSVDQARAQQPTVVTIPPIQIPPIMVPGTSLPTIMIPPVHIPPIQIPVVTIPPAPMSPTGGAMSTLALPEGLPPQVQAILSCIDTGGTGLGVAACIAEAQGQATTAQTLRSIDACAGTGGSGVETAACIAEAIGQADAAQTLRGIDGCLAAGGSDDAVTACIAETLGISMTEEQIQNASACRSAMSSSSSSSSVSGSSGSGSVSSVSRSSSVQVAGCTGAALGDDAAAQALLGCFSGAESDSGAQLVACAVGTMSPEQGAVIEGIFACIEGHRQDGDLNAFLSCVLGATGG
jgi:hypothetical protein